VCGEDGFRRRDVLMSELTLSSARMPSHFEGLPIDNLAADIVVLLDPVVRGSTRNTRCESAHSETQRITAAKGGQK
jgi:hypothetical protein